MTKDQLITVFDNLVPDKSTHKATTWELGNQILDFVQDNRAEILQALRDSRVVGWLSDKRLRYNPLTGHIEGPGVSVPVRECDGKL